MHQQTLFDVHSHLQFPDYNNDRDEVVARMKKAGVKTITVGTDIATSRQAVALAEQYPDDLWATVGIHPTELTSSPAPTRFGEAGQDVTINWDEMRQLAAHPKVVAIGECGLDYYRFDSVKRKAKSEKQMEVFQQQIEIAHKVKKPLMIHCRPSKGTDDAYEDLINILSSQDSAVLRRPDIVHFFVGSLATAKKLLALRCFFTFGGVITFARDYDEVIRFLPLEHILLETDAPSVAPEPQRGKRNEPAYVTAVAQKLADIKNATLETIIKQTTATAQTIFDIAASL